ncbi:MAG: DegV family protein, partial [Eubacteriales bacterium]|nr:DegV family protein [Eubacteriales bacterium]
MSIRIVCDSTFDLPEEESRALGIEILPLYILLGDETYMDDHK